MAGLSVVRMDPLHDPRWRRYVEEHPDALVFHHPAWLAILETEYERPAHGLACVDGSGRVEGVLGLVETFGIRFRQGHRAARRLSSLPRTHMAGPLASAGDATRALVCAATELARARPDCLLEIKLPAGDADLDVAGTGVTVVPWWPTYLLELPRDPAGLSFGDSRHRRKISWACRKAEALGIELRYGSGEDDLVAWYPLYLETMRAHMLPARPLRFFLALWEELAPGGMARLVLAERVVRGRKRLVGGSVFLLSPQTVHYAFDGRHRDDGAARASDLIQREMIEASCLGSRRFYDFGQVPPGNAGLAAFKTKWGASPRPLNRLYFPRPRSLESGAPDPSRIHRAAACCWRHVPLGLTARLGDRIYARA